MAEDIITWVSGLVEIVDLHDMGAIRLAGFERKMTGNAS
jgi:hypothetical protein